MYKMKNVLAVSMMTIAVATAANAKIVSETMMNTALSAKQNTISDLSTIRSGAAAGTTAVQPGDLSDMQEISKMVTADTGTDLTDNLSSTEKYPSMKTASKMISNALTQTTTNVSNLQSGKQDKIAAGTSGNVVTYTGTAGSVGSLGFDNAPTASSNNLVKSGAIKTALDDKVTANSAITGDTKAKITYDSKGLVTGGADLSASDIPTLATSKISGLDTALAGKQPLLTTGTDGNIVGSGSVTVSKDSTTGKITITGTDNNTTYSTGTASTAGLTKLYTGTGSNTDGTMTQSAITSALSGKQETISDLSTIRSGAAAGTTAVQPGDLSDMQEISNMVTADTGTDLTDNLSSTEMYPSMKTASKMISNALTQTTTNVSNLQSGKQDKIAAGTSGNVVTYTGTAGSVGSLGFDNAPTASSNNLVKSGAIKTALDAKVTANSAITGATKTKITYDSKGLVTSGADLSASDIPTLATSKISGLDTALAGKQPLLTTGTDGNIVGSGSVTVSKDSTTGKITITGTDNNTTYSTGTASTAGLTKLYTGTGSNTDGTMTQSAITSALGGKQATLTTGSSGNIVGSGSVTVTKDSSTGKITISGTDNNTTYSTGTASTSGLTKLYTGTGSNTDGTMTQSAITSALSGKQATISDLSTIRSGASAGATAVQPGDLDDMQLISSMVTADTGTDLTDNLSSTEMYPSMKTASKMISNALTQTTTNVANLQSGKQDKIAAGTSGNVVTYSGTAGTVGSLGFDSAPTANSNNLVKSGAIKTAVTTATNKIPSGSEGSTTLASIWVE